VEPGPLVAGLTRTRDRSRSRTSLPALARRCRPATSRSARSPPRTGGGHRGGGGRRRSAIGAASRAALAPSRCLRHAGDLVLRGRLPGQVGPACVAAWRRRRRARAGWHGVDGGARGPGDAGGGPPARAAAPQRARHGVEGRDGVHLLEQWISLAMRARAVTPLSLVAADDRGAMGAVAVVMAALDCPTPVAANQPLYGR